MLPYLKGSYPHFTSHEKLRYHVIFFPSQLCLDSNRFSQEQCGQKLRNFLKKKVNFLGGKAKSEIKFWEVYQTDVTMRLSLNHIDGDILLLKNIVKIVIENPKRCLGYLPYCNFLYCLLSIQQKRKEKIKYNWRWACLVLKKIWEGWEQKFDPPKKKNAR